jgi:hypothetical protein
MATGSERNRPKLTTAATGCFRWLYDPPAKKEMGLSLSAIEKVTLVCTKDATEKKFDGFHRPGWTLRPRDDCSHDDDTAFVLAISITLAHCSDRRRYGERI